MPKENSSLQKKVKPNSPTIMGAILLYLIGCYFFPELLLVAPLIGFSYRPSDVKPQSVKVNRFTEEQASLVMQRKWRLFKYRAEKHNKRNLDQESFETFFSAPSLLQDATEYGVVVDPASPIADNSIDKIKANQWVQSHPEAMQEIAKLTLKHIKQVSFKQFLQRLSVTVHAFNDRLMQLPKKNQQYVIILGQAGQGRSNSWVLSLALQFLVKSPVAIIPAHRQEHESIGAGRLISTLKHDPNLKTALYLDDGIYSGIQFNETLEQLLLKSVSDERREEFNQLIIERPLTLYVGVPYITRADRTYNNIRNLCVFEPENKRRVPIKVSILPHEPMLPLEQKITSKKDREEFQKNRKEIRDPGVDEKGTTYFQHRVADPFSLPTFFRGVRLDDPYELNSEAAPFIPKTNKPYSELE